MIAQHLRAWIDYASRNAKLYFWRTKNGVEVDFIVYGENDFVVIEVKNSSTISAIDLRGLKTFREDYPEAKVMMLYNGTERLLIDNILCLPCESFLKNLNPSKSLYQN